jgi:flagellar biosynthesis protein
MLMEKPRQTQGAQVSAQVLMLPPPSAPGSPIKLAVALGYVPEAEHAPRVLAGGRGAIAEQILNIAFAQGIRVREDADLVQLLATLDIDSEIPADAFAAVAEILVYVYRANGAAIATEATGPDDASVEQFLTERASRPAG